MLAVCTNKDLKDSLLVHTRKMFYVIKIRHALYTLWFDHN